MSNNSNDDDVGKRAPGERDDDDDAPKRIQNLIEAGQTQEALFLRAQQQLEHHHQSQPYPALDSAQQQLAVAIARRKQSEQEVFYANKKFNRQRPWRNWPHGSTNSTTIVLDLPLC